MQRVVLITGGSRGIGAACVEEFYKAGYLVALAYRSHVEQAERLVRQFPGTCAFRGDLSDSKEAAGMVGEVIGCFGKIDVLINNAGISLQKPFVQVGDDEFDEIMSTNVKSAFACTKAAISGMIFRRQGCIINISSMWGQVGASCEVVYSASKAAIIGLTRALAKEMGPSGIRVNCIAPGVIDTDMNSCLDLETRQALCECTPLGAIGDPADVAACALFLASDAAAFISGQVIGVNGGMVV
jgi:3-oxoacyl-[acyl-carrier protein] reductase